MPRYSIQPRDWIFVKDYGFLSFTNNMGNNIGKNISKTIKYFRNNYKWEL